MRVSAMYARGGLTYEYETYSLCVGQNYRVGLAVLNANFETLPLN